MWGLTLFIPTMAKSQEYTMRESQNIFDGECYLTH